MAVRSLLEWEDNPPVVNYLMVGACVCLVTMSGLMSGLTLGLMSLDMTQLEVLRRSGTPKEQKYARKIMPILKNSHLLLVTLLLCNAAAMEALPLFLDRLANPLTAILLSVTAVLFFGEIIPQSICTRYGLAIGARLSWFVRFLMLVCSPIAWPVGRLLDYLLGHEHHVLFRRQQLKALVDIHGEATGLGGKLSTDEIKVITGALDLTNKIAYRSMTPLPKVFMLSTADRLDEATLRAVLESGHSRIPIYRDGNRSHLVGLILVKELLQYKQSPDVPVAMLKMRSLPSLSAATPMYDCLKLFQTGRSHMAVLTQPYPGEGASCPSEAAEGSEADFTDGLSSADGEHGEGERAEGAGGGGGAEEGGKGKKPSRKGLTAKLREKLSMRRSMELPKPLLQGHPDSAAAAPAAAVDAEQPESSVALPPLDTTNNGQAGSKGHARSRRHNFVPPLAPPGTAIGIITIEDVIEELIRAEIVDETDRFVDNERLVEVERTVLLSQGVPERFRAAVASNLRDVMLKTGLGRRTMSSSVGPNTPTALSSGGAAFGGPFRTTVEATAVGGAVPPPSASAYAMNQPLLPPGQGRS